MPSTRLASSQQGGQAGYARGPIQTPLMDKQSTDGSVQAPAVKSPAVALGKVIRPVCLVLVAVGAIHEVRGSGGHATEMVHELNAMFDRAWCPLPTWLHIVLVFAAWALFVRVAKNFVKVWNRGGETN